MANTKVDIREAETDFAKLAQLIREGQIITLCEANQPFAEIRPLPPPIKARRPFGLARGTFKVPEDFGDPDQEIDKMFYGEPP